MLDYKNLHLKELRELEQEHLDLNEIIDNPESHHKFSQSTMQKFKKRKLVVKDKIKEIRSALFPNSVA